MSIPLLKRLYFSHPDEDDRSCLVLCGLQCPLNSNPSVRLSTVDVRRDKFHYDNREWSLVDLGGQVAFMQLLFCRACTMVVICFVHVAAYLFHADSPEDILENY